MLKKYQKHILIVVFMESDMDSLKAKEMWSKKLSMGYPIYSHNTVGIKNDHIKLLFD